MIHQALVLIGSARRKRLKLTFSGVNDENRKMPRFSRHFLLVLTKKNLFDAEMLAFLFDSYSPNSGPLIISDGDLDFVKSGSIVHVLSSLKQIDA